MSSASRRPIDCQKELDYAIMLKNYTEMLMKNSEQVQQMVTLEQEFSSFRTSTMWKNIETSNEIQRLNNLLEEKNNEAESLRTELALAKKQLIETSDSQDCNKEIHELKKEIQDHSDQLAFFKAKLAEKDETILAGNTELEKLRELLRASQVDVVRTKELQRGLKPTKSTVGDAEKMEPTMDLDGNTDSPRRKRKRPNQRQRRRKRDMVKGTHIMEKSRLQVVLRGVSETLSEDVIREDLTSQGFHPRKVTRWRHRDKGPLPLVLVSVPKDEERIYQQLKEVNHSKVQPEALKVKGCFMQCYNCQRFGHTSFNCHVEPKCVKCGEGHNTRSCTKSREAPAKCANCGGAHPASFMGCRSHPKHRGQGSSSSPRRRPHDLSNLVAEMNKNMQLFFTSLQNIQGRQQPSPSQVR